MMKIDLTKASSSFFLFPSADFLDLIVEETNRYAGSKDEMDFGFTGDVLLMFLGNILYSGYCPQSSLSMYKRVR